MKNLLLVLALFVGNSFAEMKSLTQYLSENENIDDGNALYISYRCLGLLGTISNITTGSTDKNSKEILSLTQKRTEKLLQSTYKIFSMVREDATQEAFLENLSISVQPLADKYQTLANENWLNNGNYFEGSELLVSDIALCNSMIDDFN